MQLDCFGKAGGSTPLQHLATTWTVPETGDLAHRQRWANHSRGAQMLTTMIILAVAHVLIIVHRDNHSKELRAIK